MDSYTWLDNLAIRSESETQPKLSEQFKLSLGKLAIQGSAQTHMIHQELMPYISKIARLEAESHHDDLTGLLNRRGFADGVGQFLSLVSRIAPSDSQAILVAAFDLDNFKSLNDTLGYSTGDNALIHTARQLRARFRRPSDLCARIGGDEFWAVSTIATEGAFLWSKSQLDSVVSDISEFEVKGSLKLGASSGAVLICGGVEISSEKQLTKFKQSFQNAEELLHHAKVLGKNKALLRVIDD